MSISEEIMRVGGGRKREETTPARQMPSQMRSSTATETRETAGV